MKNIFVFAVLITFLVKANAQTAEDSVKASVNQLFEGMKNVSPELITASFTDSAVLQTIVRSVDGNVTIKNESVSAFATSISKQTRGALDEQIQFESVKIDGDLASVWTPY